MRATGGQVNPKKCWWYLINNLVWRNGRWSYAPAVANAQPMTNHLASGERMELPKKDPSKAAEVLGVWIAPDSNNVKAVEVMTAINRKWADQLRTRPLPETHAWLSMSVLKKLEYPLVTLTLTEEDCKMINRPLLQQLLRSLGMSQSFPRVVINGPLDFQGMGRKIIYYVLGEIHLAALLRHYSDKSPMGSMMQASLQRHNLEIGAGTSMFQLDYAKYSCLATPTWMQHTWKFFHAYDIAVDMNAPCPQLRRENDQFLTT
eukprot:scaffold379767_cov59-Attheya_sp.AAC.9